VSDEQEVARRPAEEIALLEGARARVEQLPSGDVDLVGAFDAAREILGQRPSAVCTHWGSLYAYLEAAHAIDTYGSRDRDDVLRTLDAALASRRKDHPC
jgi:hypothetical protein